MPEVFIYVIGSIGDGTPLFGWPKENLGPDSNLLPYRQEMTKIFACLNVKAYLV
jgi:hypothetical protein